MAAVESRRIPVQMAAVLLLLLNCLRTRRPSIHVYRVPGYPGTLHFVSLPDARRSHSGTLKHLSTPGTGYVYPGSVGFRKSLSKKHFWSRQEVPFPTRKCGSVFLFQKTLGIPTTGKSNVPSAIEHGVHCFRRAVFEKWRRTLGKCRKNCNG
eukprot:1751271-Rhodomonas_salina.1